MIEAAIEAAEKAMADVDGFHLCSPIEFGKALIKEKTGQNIHIHAKNEWQPPYSTDNTEDDKEN